jgi:hypothetical protein
MKAVGGVYVVTRAELNLQGGNSHRILYVGQTGNLSERFDKHHKASSFRYYQASHICALAETSEIARPSIESDLIAGYNPPCNG